MYKNIGQMKYSPIGLNNPVVLAGAQRQMKEFKALFLSRKHYSWNSLKQVNQLRLSVIPTIHTIHYYSTNESYP